MNRERWETVKARFAEALELPPAERDSYLSRNCGQDEELRREVSSLLQAHAEEFLETPLELEAPEPAALSGRAIQNLRIGERIGTGGLGEVYAAVDVLTGERIAVKRLAVPAPPDAKEVARFRQEARAAMALRHPNAVRVRGFLEWEGEFLILMDMVEGQTLREILNERRLSVLEATRLRDPHRRRPRESPRSRHHPPGRQTGERHGDGGGRRQAPRFRNREARRPRRTGRKRRRGTTSRFRGREWCSEARATCRPSRSRRSPSTDEATFSPSAPLLYEMVTGRKAFDGSTVLEVIAAVLREDPPLLGSLGELDGVLRKALSKDAARRFDSMVAFRDALDELRRRASPPA